MFYLCHFIIIFRSTATSILREMNFSSILLDIVMAPFILVVSYENVRHQTVLE